MKRKDKTVPMTAQEMDLASGVITLGLDVGYGYTKAVTQNQWITFPSVWGVAREIRYSAEDIFAKYPGDYMQDEDGSWFIGDLALSQLVPAEQRMLRGRTANESSLGHVARVRLMKVALGKLFPDVRDGDVIQVRVATGLPVSHMRGAAKMKNALLGKHVINSDEHTFVVDVIEVMVMPQPYGTIYAQSLTPDGDINDCYTSGKTGIIDIGRFTVDVLVDQDMEYIDVLSDSSEAGVHLVQQSLATAYERDFDQTPGYSTVEAILRTGCFKANGQPINYTQERTAAIVPLREAVLNLLGIKWQTATDIDTISISGGGAVLVERDIRAAYPQAALVDDPQTANARGYLRYALSRTRE